MQLFDLCTAFSDNPREWEVKSPAKALPLNVRTKVRSTFGSIFAAADLARRRTASRLGIAVRPYEGGDAINALSLTHFVKTDEIVSRVDASPGRHRAGLVFHLYNHLEYKSEEALAAKGKVALAIAALVEIAHEHLMHGFEIIYVKQSDPDSALAASASRIRRWNHRYLVTDLLYPEHANLAPMLLKLGLRDTTVFVVRDPLEWTSANPLATSTERLFQSDTGAGDGEFFSGPEYIKNLQTQFDTLKKQMTSAGGSAVAYTGEAEPESVADQISQTLRRGVRL